MVVGVGVGWGRAPSTSRSPHHTPPHPRGPPLSCTSPPSRMNSGWTPSMLGVDYQQHFASPTTCSIPPGNNETVRWGALSLYDRRYSPMQLFAAKAALSTACMQRRVAQTTRKAVRRSPARPARDLVGCGWVWNPVRGGGKGAGAASASDYHDISRGTTHVPLRGAWDNRYRRHALQHLESLAAVCDGWMDGRARQAAGRGTRAPRATVWNHASEWGWRGHFRLCVRPWTAKLGPKNAQQRTG